MGPRGHDRYGEHIEAVYVTRDEEPGNALAAKALKAARSTLAIIPARVTRVETINRSSIGKLRSIHRVSASGVIEEEAA